MNVARAVANQIAYSDIRDVFCRLHPGLLEGALWITNQETIPQLLTVADGAGNYLLTPNVQSITQKWPLMIFGLPLLITDKMPALGSTGDLMLVNFEGYGVGLEQNILIDSSPHYAFDKSLTYFRVEMWGDGASLLGSAISPRNGTNTLGYAVVLAE